MDSETDYLKKLFSNSADNVFIMNYDFEILWRNKKDMVCFPNGVSFKSLLNAEDGRQLESGEYLLRCNGMEFSCNLINFKEQKLYVLQMSGEDVMFNCLKSGAVRDFFRNQTAQVRTSVSGIATSVSMFRNLLDGKSLKKISQYLDITTGNCNNLLRTVMNPSELIKYTESDNEPININLSEFLEKFSDICRNILGDQYDFVLNTAPQLYISADPNRLTTCLLALIVLAGKSNSDNKKLLLTADKIGEYVSITAASEAAAEPKSSPKLFSRFEPMFQNEAADSNLFVVYRFCRTYNGMFFVADKTDNDKKAYSIRLPFCDENNGEITLSSASEPYPDGMFSNYRIALSEIADII